MKTKKQLLESFSKLKVTTNDFDHYNDGERYSIDTYTIDNYIDENFAINVEFEETAIFDSEGWYEIISFEISSLYIWDAETQDELFIDVTDEELLNALKY